MVSSSGDRKWCDLELTNVKSGIVNWLVRLSLMQPNSRWRKGSRFAYPVKGGRNRSVLVSLC